MSGNFTHDLRRIAFRPDNAPFHRAMSANAAGDCPGVHITEAGNLMLFQIADNAAFFTPVAGIFTQLRYDEPSHKGFSGLVKFGIHAVVADQRIGHGDNLPGIRRIRQHFLISGHAGVEHHFAGAFQSVQQKAVESRAVSQYQLSSYKFTHTLTCPSRITILPSTTVITARPFNRRPEKGLALPRV